MVQVALYATLIVEAPADAAPEEVEEFAHQLAALVPEWGWYDEDDEPYPSHGTGEDVDAEGEAIAEGEDTVVVRRDDRGEVQGIDEGATVVIRRGADGKLAPPEALAE
jgi:hypothetical protein